MTLTPLIVTMAIFLSLIGVIALFVRRGGSSTGKAADYYVAGRGFTGPQNGLALCGAFLMVTSFLAMTGEIALNGFDALLFAVSFVVAWLVMLLLVAEPLRNTSKFSLGDTLSVRFSERPVRTAAATVTLVVFFFYMTVQLVFVGQLASLLLGVPGRGMEAAVVIVVGLLTTVILYYGGMRGATWSQMVKAVLLLAGVVLLAGLVLARYHMNVSDILDDAVAAAGPGGERLLVPGTRFGEGGTLQKLEFVSQLVTVVLGHAALPYLFIRFLTVPTAREARRSVSWAVWLLGPYYLLIALLGFGAAAILGPEMIESSPGHRMSAAPLLAAELGGMPLMAFIGAVVLLTVVSVTAGLAISAATAFTRDIYSHVFHRGRLDEAREVAVTRRAVVVLCLLMTGFGVLFLRQNVGFMLALDVTLVASSILPTLLYSWFWRGFNTSGALWSIYGGMLVTILLVVFSPTISGHPEALFPGADFAIFPWKYVGLVSMPLAFLLGYVGAKLSKEHDPAKFAEMEVRALTGAGAERPSR